LEHNFILVNNKDIKQAKADIHYAVEKIKNSQNQIEAAQEAQKIVASQFKNGTAKALDITAAATNVQKAGLSLLQAQLQLSTAVIELAKQMGVEYWKD
jgi:outer membrane protein TolC